MKTALYLNGIYEGVLEEILNAQKSDPERTCYLQPYSTSRIKLLADSPPSPHNPIRFYASTTTHLANVSYMGDVVGWECKQDMSSTRLVEVNKEFQHHQPSEKEVYMEVNGKACVNLIHVKHLVLLKTPISVTALIKKNGDPVKPRTRAGNWAYVDPLPDWVGVLESSLEEHLDEELAANEAKSTSDLSATRQERLSVAPKLPQRVQIISRGFRRNADVIAEVKLRAKGKCEACGDNAPFLRASDGTPFLEIHHIITLAEGGEDTVDNAQALCPNCHREKHFGS